MDFERNALAEMYCTTENFGLEHLGQQINDIQFPGSLRFHQRYVSDRRVLV